MAEAVDAIVNHLKRTALFNSVAIADLRRVARLAHEKTFEANQLIFAKGDAGSCIYLVLQGRVRFSVFAPDGRSVAFGHAKPGEVFGEIAALDGGTRSSDATALARVRLLLLDRNELLQLIATTPRLAEAAIALLTQKLRATSKQLEEIALNSVEVRLARWLHHLASGDAKRTGSAPVALNLGMSRGELALLIGSSRQSTSSAFANLTRAGAIRRVGSAFECDVSELKKMIGDL